MPRLPLRVAALALLAAAPLLAQPSPAPRPAGPSDAATMVRRTQLVLPPAGWRIGAMIERAPAADVAEGGAPGFPASQALTRTQLRLGFPTYRRGLYRTVVTNEVAVDEYRMDYGDGALRGVICSLLPGAPCTPPLGAPAAPRYLSLQHELLASQALGDRWRLTGVMFTALHTTDFGRLRAEALRVQGGAFLARTYRPTLQVGAGVLAINVWPYVIPTIRYLHVGRKWRADVLVPRGEAFYEVNPEFEIGGQFRFFGNRWDMNDEVPELRGRTTMTFTHVGPAFNWKPAKQLVVTGDAGLLLRRFRIDAATPFATQLPSVPAMPPTLVRGATYDPEAGAYARLRTTWFF